MEKVNSQNTYWHSEQWDSRITKPEPASACIVLKKGKMLPKILFFHPNHLTTSCRPICFKKDPPPYTVNQVKLYILCRGGKKKNWVTEYCLKRGSKMGASSLSDYRTLYGWQTDKACWRGHMKMGCVIKIWDDFGVICSVRFHI